MKLSMVVLAGLFLSMNVSAAEQPAAMPQMPTPAPELDKLSFMLGDWSIKEQHEAWPGMHDAYAANGRDVVAKGPGDFSIINYYTSSSAMGPSTGHGTTYWDAEDGVYRMIWLDSWSAKPSFSTGTWEGDKLVFTGSVEMAGETYEMKYEYRDISDKGYTMEFWMNGNKTMTMVAKREKQQRSAGL